MTTTTFDSRKRSKFAKSYRDSEGALEARGNARILLESACVDVIGRLEYLIARSEFEITEGYLGESALIGDKMLCCLAEFAEGHLTGQRLAIVNEFIDRGRKATKRTVDLATTQTFGSIRRIIGLTAASDGDVAAAHQDTGKLIATAAIATLGGGIRELEVEGSIAKELYASLQPILSTLREKW